MHLLGHSVGAILPLLVAVRTAGREVRAVNAVQSFDKDILASICVPTLFLPGAGQDHPACSGIRGLADQLTFGRVGQVLGRHLALISAPDAFVAVT